MRSVLERKFKWIEFLTVLRGISASEFLDFYNYFKEKVLVNCVGKRSMSYEMVLCLSMMRCGASGDDDRALLKLAGLCNSFVRVEQPFCSMKASLEGGAFLIYVSHSFTKNFKMVLLGLGRIVILKIWILIALLTMLILNVLNFGIFGGCVFQIRLWTDSLISWLEVVGGGLILMFGLVFVL